MTDQPVEDLQSNSAIDHLLLRLERQVRDIRTDDGSERITTANRLSEIERELINLSAKLDKVDAGYDGGSVIADVEDWAELCEELSLDDVADAARELIGDFFQKSARAWKSGIEAELAQPTADSCFRRLLETTARRCEAARSDKRAVDDGLFAEVTDAIRQSFHQCLTAEPPATETRQQWMTGLSDYVDLVLTTIDDLPPERAAGELSLIEDYLQWHLKNVENSFGRPRRRLRRKLARVRAEMQERQLQHRLERRFGLPFVGFSERLVLALICLVVALMAIEVAVKPSDKTLFWFTVVDSCACFVFLCEFFTKLWIVDGRARWFRRHFLIDLIPSIPIGLILSGLPAAGKADTIRLGRLARFLRLPRLARYVRLLRPLLRMLRGFGLLARGLDRLARRYGHLLNQNVILYPTRAELERAESTEMSDAVDLERLRGRLRDHWKLLLREASATERFTLVDVRQELFGAAFDRAVSRETIEAAAPDTRVREIPAGTLIENFESSTPQSIADDLGDELVGQLARMTRIFARPPLRWFPVIRRCVPTLDENMTNAEVTAAAAQRIARVIKGYYNTWFWVADLYGTVTPSQFIDRVGTMLVNRSFRPAYRLVLFGGFFLLTDLILSLTDFMLLEPVREFLDRAVGPVVLIIGGVCFFILGLGFWLKRVAREATEFYEQSVQAQFLSLTEVIRSRYLKRDAEILYDRVLGPGCLLKDESAAGCRDEHLEYLLDRVHQSLLDAHMGGDDRGIDGIENTVLLYRDWLDGALLTDTDTRSTSQLLGNPAIRQFLSLSGRVDRKQVKALQRLDLVRQKSLLGGPYLWFNFISRSIAHSVAMLLVDYNQQAVPLGELPRISPADRKRYDRWLTGERQLPLQTSEEETAGAEKTYITTSFTALHFLDFDEHRDREVENRFGQEVLLRLQTDRSLMIRRIFGTYPMHNRPKEQRVVNLFSLYNSWLAGGRALLMPLYVLGLLFRLMTGFLAWMARSIKEIRDPELRTGSRDAAKAHFYSAIRKIERIRGPVVDASLLLRMKLDPEFLGVPLPGRRTTTLGPANVDADLRFLNSGPATTQRVDEERQRAHEDMQRLQALIDGGLLERIAPNAGLPTDAFNTSEHMRAAAIAYLGDYREVRRHLSARALLDEILLSATDRPLPAEKSRPRPLLSQKFRRYWRQHSTGNRRDRRAAWRAAQHNVRGVADALSVWNQLGEAATVEGEKLLGEILLHPGRINEQLMAIRVVQSLAVLDVLNYREHIYHLGRYADMGDKPGRLLEWNTTVREGNT